MEKEIKKEKYNNTISGKEKICFDNEKYLKIEKKKILESLLNIADYIF